MVNFLVIGTNKKTLDRITSRMEQKEDVHCVSWKFSQTEDDERDLEHAVKSCFGSRNERVRVVVACCSTLELGVHKSILRALRASRKLNFEKVICVLAGLSEDCESVKEYLSYRYSDTITNFNSVWKSLNDLTNEQMAHLVSNIVDLT